MGNNNHLFFILKIQNVFKGLFIIYFDLIKLNHYLILSHYHITIYFG
jgi:hypothetical protein